MDNSVIYIAANLSFTLLLIALIFALIRLLKGPTVYDRITALDLIASIAIGFIMIYSIVVKRELYFDLAIVIALISFLGTLAVSTFLKHKNKQL